MYVPVWYLSIAVADSSSFLQLREEAQGGLSVAQAEALAASIQSLAIRADDQVGVVHQ